MTLAERLAEHVRACFTAIWIRTHEPDDALDAIAALCREQGWSLTAWDLEHGLSIPGQSAAPAAVAADPLSAVRSLAALAAPDGTSLLVLRNFHRFLNGAEVVQALEARIAAGKRDRTIVLILSPVFQPPAELERRFAVIEHELPDRSQLESIARGVATEPGELPEGESLTAVLDAAAGLTRVEAEDAFSLALVRHGRLEPAVLWELKQRTLKASGLLTLHRDGGSFDELGGLDALKSFCARALRRRSGGPSETRARGILLLGVPGTGKSAFAKALGRETGRPTLALDVGALLGSLVGETERRVRDALRVVDAMAPCIVFCDELEKALAGHSGNAGDSGVSARLFGSLLSWLSDHESDAFFVGTCNDVSRLPPEFARAERFDGIFFLDLPGEAEKQQIWTLYLRRFGLDPEQRRPTDRDWTGAEIRACCRLASLLDLPLVDAARNVVPVATTAAESVERLRSWASGRCLAADLTGIYTRGTPPAGKGTRNLRRIDPSVN